MGKEKIRIALLNSSSDNVFCFRREIIEELAKEGYEVLVSCPYGDMLETMRDTPFLHENVKMERRGMNILSDFGLCIQYWRFFKNHKPDIVLCYTAKPNVYGGMISRLLHIPYIINVTGLGSVIKKSGMVQALIMSLFKMSYRHAACVFFQNNANMHMALEHGMLKGKYQIIPGSGVNIERFPLLPYPEGGDGITGETVIFNYIGRVLHDKGIDDYIAAAGRIKKAYPNTEFNVVGFIEPTESHYQQDLEKLQREGIVCYRGNQKDVKPFLARAHATIHPSTYGEGMSNALLESAASGRPLITTDNPGCQETVDDGSTGFIYPGGNVDKLVKSVERILAMKNKERKEMGQKGRAKMENEFNRRLVVDAYLNEIGRILKR